MPNKKLDIKPIIIKSLRVKHQAASVADGTLPGWLVKCHNCSTEFEVANCNLQKGYGNFCSRRCSGLYRRRSPEEVLMSHVEKQADGCWIFTGSTMSFGHGQVRLHDGKLWLTHRLSWTLRNGAIPKGMNVCHRCDVPACVNPDHLFLGSQLDNIRDASVKGRLKRS